MLGMKAIGGNGMFKPNESASRAESVAMIIRLLDKLLSLLVRF
jgi:hypothetical protein